MSWVSFEGERLPRGMEFPAANLPSEQRPLAVDSMISIMPQRGRGDRRCQVAQVMLNRGYVKKQGFFRANWSNWRVKEQSGQGCGLPEKFKAGWMAEGTAQKV